MSNFTGYETMLGSDGEIYQAGIPSRLEYDNDTGTSVWGLFTRAVILAIYYPEEDDRNGWVQGKQKNITCDIRTIGRYSRNLYRVPVLQNVQGLWDCDLYTLRATSVNISGGDLITGSAAKDGNLPTSAEDTDGDQVIVGFLENNPKLPVIFPFTLGHPSGNSFVKKDDGRIRRIRHNGVVIEIDKEGNLTLDARSAAKPDYDQNGQEISNSGIGGKITIKTKDGAGAESHFMLDEQGNLSCSDGSGGKLEFTKASQSAILSTGQKITVNTGSTIEAVAPAITASASGSFAVTSPSVQLGDGAALELVKHLPWASAWNALAAVLTPLAAAWKIPPLSSLPLTHSEMAPILDAIAAVCSSYASTKTTKVKGT